MRRRSPAPEGTVFLVPVEPRGFAVGVLVRTDGQGRAYGAFFGPRVADATEVQFSLLLERNAILRCRFGDHGLHHKLWQVVGSIPDWRSQRWGLPKFVRQHDDPKLCFVSTYDDNLTCIDEQLQPMVTTPELPADIQLGSAIVETKLAKLLG